MTTPFEHRSVSVAGSLILWLCLASSSLAAGPKQNSDDKAFGEFVAAEQQLAGRLFESLLRENLAGNTAVAPYCLFESLGLLETASHEATAAAFRKVLGVESVRDSEDLFRRARTVGLPFEYSLPITVESNSGYGLKLTSDPSQGSSVGVMGLRKGDLIFSINGEAVRELDDLSRLLNEAGRSIELGGYLRREGLPFEARRVNLDRVRIESAAPERRTARFATALWTREGLRLRDEWTKRIGSNFEARVMTSAPGSPQQLRPQWNEFFQTRLGTSAPIPDLADLPANAAFLLVSSLVIDAPWLLPFNERETQVGPFKAPGGPADASFMRKTARFRYVEQDGWRMLELPCRESTLTCRLVLPSPRQDADPKRLGEIFSTATELPTASMEQRTVEVHVPKFDFQSRPTLNSFLQQSGARVAFSSEADFSDMTDDRSIRLADVRQVVQVQMHEVGLRVAAVTESLGVLKSVEPEPTATFRADRPFLFIVRDESGLVLAAGRVTNPSRPALKTVDGQ